MSDEPVKLAESMTPEMRERAKVMGRTCEHEGCGKVAGWGFVRPRQDPHWFCYEHRGDGDRYL
ncbi:hypothetical protein FJ976_16085 [Mesorhizobium sp. B1-1-9]|nr:hypothetical protein FJ976_16085 [Mesorhizobium sp. B1-1-9]